jgi:GT2 family glycosyltransferase
MKLGFVFTNYNNWKFTKGVISSIEKLKNDYLKIIIVDNASNEKDLKKLKSFEKTFPFVKIIYSDKNLGYFKGLNLGLEHLKKHCTNLDFIIIGNNDLIFSNSFYSSLKNKQKDLNKYPVVSPDIITSDGFHQNPHVIKKISKIREVIYDLYHFNFFIAKLILFLSNITKSLFKRKDESFFQIPQEIYQGYGACYILTPLFFKNFEYLWAPTFLMYEEFFLSKQLSDKKYKIFYEPSITVTHLMHASTGKLTKRKKWMISKESHKEYRKYIKIFK